MPRSTKAAIKTLGYDVLDVRDILPPASPDSDIAKLAIRENRVIITRDQDFANILLYPPAEYPGIIVLKIRPMKPSDINRLMELFLTTNPSETVLNSLIILESSRFRRKR